MNPKLYNDVIKRGPTTRILKWGGPMKWKKCRAPCCGRRRKFFRL